MIVDHKIVNGKRVAVKRQKTQAERDADEAQKIVDNEARADAQSEENARLSKKLRKSQLRALKQQNQDATSIAKLKAVNVEMIKLFENVVAYQQVDIEDD